MKEVTMHRRANLFAAALTVLAALVPAVVCSAASAAEEAVTLSEAEFRRYATIFLDQPLSEEGQAAAGFLLKFVEDTDKVSVTIAPWFVPWIFGEKEYKNTEWLLAAYAIGNALSQLDSGICVSDAYSGEIQVFRVYRHMKAKDASYSVPEIENLLAVHKKGELAAYLAKAEKEGRAKLAQEQSGKAGEKDQKGEKKP
jgi:hypothetical protein